MNGFRDAYSAKFDEYLVTHDENALHAAYELGRDAVERELSVLDLASAHHDVLARSLAREPTKIEATTRAAEQFFLESLSAFEIVQRGYREARETAALEQRNTAILRQLSSFLADASLAVDAHHSLIEMLQLLAEQAREIVDADACIVQLEGLHATSQEEQLDEPLRLVVPLTSLDGRELGTIAVARGSRVFSALEEAILTHLAQMAAAAVERVRLYAART